MIKLRFERGFNNDPLDTPPTQFQFGLDQVPVQAVNRPNEQIKGADGSIRLRRKCEQGTACATDHPFGGAPEKQIEQTGMSFGHHDNQIHIEISPCR
jgi:hypothetical protein